MAVYAVGDLQGCYDPFCRLLDTIDFDPVDDKLWLVGDLVNRGHDSLSTLRLVRTLGDAAISVLGNHDIHLLALHHGLREPKPKDADLQRILEAQDAETLIGFVRQLPLLHVDEALQCCMVHAGLHPDWTLDEARTLANELQTLLSTDDNGEQLATLYGNTSGGWRENRNEPSRLKFALNCFTRMRFLHADGALNFTNAGPPGSQPDTLIPWFDTAPKSKQQIIFGHWAALGYFQRANFHAIDSGCVWGNQLTAIRLPDFTSYAVDCGARSSTRQA